MLCIEFGIFETKRNERITITKHIYYFDNETISVGQSIFQRETRIWHKTSTSLIINYENEQFLFSSHESVFSPCLKTK